MKISITQQKPVKFVVNQEDDELHTFTGFVDSKTNALILGCYKYKDIYIYKGEWKDGKKNGMGEMVFLPKDSSNINEELIYNSVASKTLKISRTQIQIRDGSIDNKSKISSLTHYLKTTFKSKKKDIKCFRCN
jgi:hypothetical protein